MKSLLRKIYGYAKRLIVSDLRYSQYLFEDVIESNVSADTKLLDLGCGHHLLSPWRLEEEKKLVGRASLVIGIDYDFPSLVKHKTITKKVHGSIDALPFPNDHFNVAISNMVVEHLDDPQIQFAEVNRVLAKDGLFIFHTVNEHGHFALMRKMTSGKFAKKLAYFLEDRVSDDVFEVHYKANSAEKIQELAKNTGFRVEKIKFISSDAVFAVVPPLAVLELIWIKILMKKSYEHLRTNIIVILKKMD